MHKKSVLAALACGLVLSAVHAATPAPAPAAPVRAADGMVTFVKKVRHHRHRVVTRTTHRRTTHTETHSTAAGSTAK